MFDYRKLRKARKKSKMVMSDVVRAFAIERVEISHPTIVNHESGRTTPDAKILATYASVYNVPVIYFFNLKPNQIKFGTGSLGKEESARRPRFSAPAIRGGRGMIKMIAALLLIPCAAYADVSIDQVIRVESSGNPRAVSKADCRGLMQMSRIAWADVRKHYPEMKYDFDKYAFDPAVNVRMGTLYLEIIKTKYLKGGGSDKDILICYHDGFGNWKKWKRGERKLGREMLQNLARYGVK